MGLKTIYRLPTADDQAGAFCRCRLRSNKTTYRGTAAGASTDDCHCGESDCTRIDWNFNDADEPSAAADVRIMNAGTDITFHPVYSQGTAVVRANRSLELHQNLIHYWEIKIMSCMSGTDTVSTNVIFFLNV